MNRLSRSGMFLMITGTVLSRRGILLAGFIIGGLSEDNRQCFVILNGKFVCQLIVCNDI